MNAVDLDAADRDELAGRVDTDLKRGERETGVSFFDGDERAVVTSYSPSIVRPLLRHDKSRIRWIYATGSGEPTGRIREPLKLLDTDTNVEGVQVDIPKGTLSIKGSVRSTNEENEIVNTPAEAEKVRQAFADTEEVEQ